MDYFLRSFDVEDFKNGAIDGREGGCFLLKMGIARGLCTLIGIKGEGWRYYDAEECKMTAGLKS